jgi:hypothetical protein
MSNQGIKYDFEKAWQGKLSQAIKKTVGEEIRDQVLAGAENLKEDTPAKKNAGLAKP